MKKNITSLFILALSLITNASFSQTTFEYTGTVETYTVPDGVTSISIQAYGAQGGNINGGLGAGIYGEFSVVGGQELNIVVGSQGVVNNCGGSGASGGGGGGSFVWDPTSAALPWIAAGGGGGGNQNWTGECIDGLPGLAGENGGNGAEDLASGGTGGNGGAGDAPSGAGAGGGGWLSVGGNSTWSDPAFGGATVPGFEGGIGSPGFGPGGEGGFGGGGGAVCGCGGGGGYSGGAGGNGSSCRAGGGGGGSYNAGTDTLNQTGVNEGNGQIIITTLCEALTITASVSLESMGADGAIDITVTGGDGTYIYDWDNDGTGDFDDTEDLTGLTAGVYVVNVDDENGCPIATDSIAVESELSVNDNVLITNVYPNPTEDNIQINTTGEFSYTITSVTGQVLITGSGVNNETVDLSAFEAGSYLLTVSQANQAQTIPIIRK